MCEELLDQVKQNDVIIEKKSNILVFMNIPMKVAPVIKDQNLNSQKYP